MHARMPMQRELLYSILHSIRNAHERRVTKWEHSPPPTGPAQGPPPVLLELLASTQAGARTTKSSDPQSILHDQRCQIKSIICDFCAIFHTLLRLGIDVSTMLLITVERLACLLFNAP